MEGSTNKRRDEAHLDASTRLPFAQFVPPTPTAVQEAVMDGIRGCRSLIEWKPDADNRAAFIAFGALVVVPTTRMTLQGRRASRSMRSSSVQYE